MAEYENNAFFWQKVDTLYLSSNLQMTKKKGEVHDQFANLVYPVDYGRLEDTNGVVDGVSVYVGSKSRSSITALVVAADILKKTLDVKILAGCNDEEVEAVLRYLNQTEFQKTVLIRRGSAIPAWGESAD